ncbi:MAG: hypothetical protein JKY96_07790 [Phycisphaerales bacterium]|nr:hypothetical protein [Phycisphaerales bacterium]
MSIMRVAAGADAILDQCACFVDGLDDDQFVRPSKIVGGTIGMHMRHTLDHFRSAITTPCSDLIDYDHRERGGSLETCRTATLAEITTLRSLIGGLDEPAMASPMTACVMVSSDGQTAELGSTRARELFFAMHHAIHHNALVKAIGNEIGITSDDCFGKAPSTINFEHTGA